MGFVFGVLLILAICAVALYLAGSATANKERLVRELHKVDEQIGKEANQARRAMNDAAGQSWRNQFE